MQPTPGKFAPASDQPEHVGQTARVSSSTELGAGRRWADYALAVAGVMPIWLGVLAHFVFPSSGSAWARLSIFWAGALLIFLGGVRRGLTFSEVGGGRWSELATMIALFSIGVVTMAIDNLAIAIAGCVFAGIGDSVAARRRQAPDYFVWLRPLQLGSTALVLSLLAL